MSALPLRATLAGTPSKAAAQALFLEWYDFNAEKLGSDAGAAPVTVASASTVDLDAVTTVRDIVVSGTTAITGFTIGRGKVFLVRASGAFTLTNNASIVTHKGTNILTEVGDSFVLRATATDTVEVVNYTRAAERTSKIQSITASVGSNALTITVNPTTLDFRSATLGSGTVSTRTLAAAASLVISSGSTLGTVNAVQSRIAVLLIDNAGTLEVAAVNISGGNDLNETGLISTTAEGGAGAADSATVIYSTTARSSVPYRVVGYVESTQATAGTWATAPSTIQGQGGQALAAMSSLGYGQTWQSVTGSRLIGTTYYNTTGKPISIAVVGNPSTAMVITLTIGGVVADTQSAASSVASNAGVHGIIPPGSSYAVTVSTGVLTVNTWSELR